MWAHGAKRGRIFRILKRPNIGRLGTLGSVIDVEFDFLPLVQTAVSASRDGRKVSEYIRTSRVRRNKAETFFGIEPFDLAFLRHDLSAVL